MVEWWEDRFEEDKNLKYKYMKDEDGNISFEGMYDDPLLEKWEKELSMGITPDFNEGLTDSVKSEIEKLQKKKGRSAIAIDDNYLKGHILGNG